MVARWWRPGRRPGPRAERVQLRRRQGGEEGLHPALDVEVVVHRPDRRRIQQPVEEAQRAEPRRDDDPVSRACRQGFAGRVRPSRMTAIGLRTFAGAGPTVDPGVT